ncbi:MAG TPA: hemolysin family protein [Actinomycetota bacterium]|nr:hemolysin family protein [Actinomycetota bacterium]
MTWAFIVGIALLLANGFFVAAEFAVIAAGPSKLENLAAAGGIRAKAALRSANEVSLMLSAAQLGITMASLGLGFVAEPAVAHLLEGALEGLGLPSGVIHTLAFVIALGIISFLHMVIGEMAPKNVTIAEPERVAIWIAIPFRIYVMLFRPFIWFFNLLANAGTRAFGVEPQDERSAAYSPGEIRLIITESARSGELDRFEHRLLTGAASFGERDAASVMVPRTEMVAAPLSITPLEIEGIVVATGHSRIPLYAKDLDDVVGFFHSKDLLRIPADAGEDPIPRALIRPMLMVPESLRLHPLLLEMRRRRQHFALVLDEHGGTAGVVTLEDLLEELVGEIRDEYDATELGIERLSEDRYLVPGSLRVDEAADRLGVQIPEGEYETVAGFIMDRLGRIPRRRDVIEHDGWKLWVRSMHRRRVVQVLIERA